MRFPAFIIGRGKKLGVLGVIQPRLTTALGQGPHATNIRRPLGDGDHTARIEQVKAMAGLNRLIVGGKRKTGVQKIGAFLLGIDKVPQQGIGVGFLYWMLPISFFLSVGH